jgi:polysaccharide deacetylase family protein (PEP-CTERM system associated)
VNDGIIINAMTVDVEDYFHVTAFADDIKSEDWHSLEYRAEKNTERVLQIFSEGGVKATFFVLGWIAMKSPNLIRKIYAEGHEIACHGMTHQLVYQQTQETFLQETRDSKHLLEDLISDSVIGYRAASYSIVQRSYWALEVLEELGFKYDSSIFPIRHDIYGMPDAPRFPFHPISSQLIEIPLTTVEVLGYRLPCGGGGYFRILPYFLFKAGLERVNKKDKMPGVFYFHPWEIDTEQPRMNTNWRSGFRHYHNISHTKLRLMRLLNDFRWGRIDKVFDKDILDEKAVIAHVAASI